MTDYKSLASTGTHSEQDRDTILKVEHVGKKFAYSVRDTMRYGTGRILRELLGLKIDTERLRSGEFWAVDDVSFELKRGETLGIIGSNGAGKSTLLKLINGVFLPDKGRIAVRGAVGGLIEIGAGFQPKLSGRDNIYIIGSVLGFSKQQIAAMVDEIVEFADLGKFIDSPVQTYSSGMQVRLGFAIHVFQKPDILLADEVLAVGDFEFQQKCLAKVNEVRKDLGMILVSHSMPIIARFCDRVMVMQEGRICLDGKPSEAVAYVGSGRHNKVSRTDTAGPQPVSGSLRGGEVGDGPRVSSSALPNTGRSGLEPVFGIEHESHEKIAGVICSWDLGRSQAESCAGMVRMFSSMAMTFSFCLLQPTQSLVIGIPLFGLDGRMLTGFSTDCRSEKISIGRDGKVSGRLVIQSLSLNPGTYVPAFTVYDGVLCLFRKVLPPLKVVVDDQDSEQPRIHWGVYTEAVRWEFSQPSHEGDSRNHN